MVNLGDTMKLEGFAVAGLAATIADMLIDIPLFHADILYAVKIQDAEGKYIWGYGLGDAIIDLLGVAMTTGKLGVPSTFGLCWLLTHGFLKLAELAGYLMLRANVKGAKYVLTA